MHIIYTIGYSSYLVEDFIQQLKARNINCLIDVRSSPYSARYSEYNKENLELKLKDKGIIYRNYANEFGARQKNRELYTNGILDFAKFARTKNFLSGVSKLKRGHEIGYKIALMCSEIDPLNCHRNILIANNLNKKEFTVINILRNGNEESQTESEIRLMKQYFSCTGQITMFREDDLTEKEMIRLAFVKKNKEIGVKEEDIKCEYIR